MYEYFALFWDSWEANISISCEGSSIPLRDTW